MKYNLFKLTLYTLLLTLNLWLAQGMARLLLADASAHPPAKYVWQVGVYLLIFFYLRLLTRRMVTTSEAWLVIKGSFIGLIISFALLSLLKQADQYSRLMILSFFLFNLLLPPVIYSLKRWALRHPFLRERVLLVCDAEACDHANEWLVKDNPFGFDIGQSLNINHFSPEGLAVELERVLENEPFFATVIMLENTGMERTLELMEHLQHKVRRILLVPRMTHLPLFNAEVFNSINQKGLIFFVRNNLLSESDLTLKHLSDLTLALALTVLLAPLLLVLYVWVAVATRGQPIFRQKRIGMDGKPFKIYKFRTMRPDAEQLLTHILATDPAAREEWERDYKLRADPRITKIGHFLRRTSLDELPQLVNVLRGQMSLVGPRPIVAEEMVAYGDYIDYYKQVRPGITGLWQVSGRNEVSYEERVQLDVWYVRNWSLELDLIILTKTLVAVLLRKGSY